MFFVWSWWYLVIAIAVAGIVALAVVLVKMNRKDIALIEAFQNENAVENVEAKSEPASTKKAE